jgi:hypothetical protein
VTDPVMRDRVLDICLEKPELAEAMYVTAKTVTGEISEQAYDEYLPGGLSIGEKGWTYDTVPIRASHLGYLLDMDITEKVVDTNSRSIFTFVDPELVVRTVEEFSQFRSERLRDRPVRGHRHRQDVDLVRDGNFYRIEWEHGSLEVPPNQLVDLFEGVKEAWRSRSYASGGRQKQEE